MKYLDVRGGLRTALDDDDYEYYSQWKWGLHKDGYVIRSSQTSILFLHRLINKTPKGLETDHINRDKLDNRKSNLRSVSLRKNKYNIPVKSNNNSGYTGVGFDKTRGRWRARIGGNKLSKHIGYYDTIEEAIEARKIAFEELYERLS